MKPFIKWAGGKRWLAASEYFLVPEFSGRYFEPFLGGGAMFFHLKPANAVLTDVNRRLIETYTAIRDDWQKVVKELEHLQRLHSVNFYYEERRRRRRSPHTRAAQFLYLNRTCFNGLYRENLNGEFNVPIGTKDSVIFEGEDFGGLSTVLNTAEIYASDFETVIDRASAGDLVFADPPYTTAHNVNGFLKYNQRIFTWEDQVRLRNAVARAYERGAKVVVTNADHKSIRQLYGNMASFQRIGRVSVMAGSAHFRGSTSEGLYFVG